MEDKTTQLIEAYLLGQLGEAETRAVALRAEKDPEFAAALELQQNIFEGIEYWGDGQIKNNIAETDRLLAEKGFFDPPADAHDAQPAGRSSVKRLRLVALAAVIAAIAIGVWQWQRLFPGTPPDTNAPDKTQPETAPDTLLPIAQFPKLGIQQKPSKETPDSNPRYGALAQVSWSKPDYSNVRSAQEKNTTLFSRAAEAFQKDDFETVIKLLTPTVSKTPADWPGLEMFAHACFLSGKTRQAATHFRQIAESRQLPYSERAEWFLTLCYLAGLPQQEPEFNRALQKISIDQGHPYYDAAQKIKAQIRK
jgi:hypothetical protein